MARMQRAGWWDWALAVAACPVGAAGWSTAHDAVAAQCPATALFVLVAQMQRVTEAPAVRSDKRALKWLEQLQ